MDDDDVRRGRPSCHAKFGEAIAVLAGDALQVLAFRVLSELRVPAETRVRVLGEITAAVGTAGVIGGQVVDIESEKRRIRPDTLRWIHAHKTGELLRASLVAGALAGGGGAALTRRLGRFGTHFGLLFQIVDDLLDAVGTASALGREGGRDRDNRKATYPSILGLERSREALAKSFQACRESIPASENEGLYGSLMEAVVSRLPRDWTASIWENGLRSAPRANGRRSVNGRRRSDR